MNPEHLQGVMLKHRDVCIMNLNKFVKMSVKILDSERSRFVKRLVEFACIINSQVEVFWVVTPCS